eukprot:Sspe_Gene.103695::Locus_79534_Transcript_1_1_Confidence_1.000_Length_1563::g.103695::m.103695
MQQTHHISSLDVLKDPLDVSISTDGEGSRPWFCIPPNDGTLPKAVQRMLHDSNRKIERLEARLAQKEQELEELRKVQQPPDNLEDIEVDQLVAEAVREGLAAERERERTRKEDQRIANAKDKVGRERGEHMELMRSMNRAEVLRARSAVANLSARYECSIMAYEDQWLTLENAMAHQSAHAEAKKKVGKQITRSEDTRSREEFKARMAEFEEKLKLQATDDALVEAKLGSSTFGAVMQKIRDLFSQVVLSIKHMSDSGLGGVWRLCNEPTQGKGNKDMIYREMRKMVRSSKQHALDGWRKLNQTVMDFCALEAGKAHAVVKYSPNRSDAECTANIIIPDPRIERLETQMQVEQDRATSARRAMAEAEKAREVAEGRARDAIRTGMQVHMCIWSSATEIHKHRLRFVDKLVDPFKQVIREAKDKEGDAGNSKQRHEELFEQHCESFYEATASMLRSLTSFLVRDVSDDFFSHAGKSDKSTAGKGESPGARRKRTPS